MPTSSQLDVVLRQLQQKLRQESPQKGLPGARLTVEAEAALARLARRRVGGDGEQFEDR
jgi:hypothetical protein